MKYTKYLAIFIIMLVAVVLFLPLVNYAPATAADVTPTPVNYLPIVLKPESTPVPLPEVKITHIHYGAAIDNEWLVVTNEGISAQDLTGWKLSNEVNDTFVFPDGYLLGGGKGMRVWSKSGTDTQSYLYWDINKDVWNKGGDTATLRDENGTVISECPYVGGSVSVDC